MSLTEVMQEVDSLNPEERLKLQSYLVHLRRKDDPAHRAELKQRIDQIHAGRFATEADLLRHLKPSAGGPTE